MLNMELSDYGDFGGELENVWLLDVAGDLNETVEDWDSLPVPGDDDETP